MDLEKSTNAVPVGPQVFSVEHQGVTCGRTLPLQVEQQLADDFAFLAAVEEGAQSVAAVCLEEHLEPVGLTVRFAALDLSLNDQVENALQHIADGLNANIPNIDDAIQIEVLFEQVVQLHFRRLLARLRSKKWVKPKFLSRQHKKPLWQDFANLIHRVQFLYSKKEATLRQSVESKLLDLASPYEEFDASKSGSQEETFLLQELVKASYRFCKAEDVAEFARRLQDSVNTIPTPKVASALKCLRQIEKIAAYWRIVLFLVNTSREYPSLFEVKLRLAFLKPYKSVPTSIGYETWATTCHVHAEVQLVVYYDLIFQSFTQFGSNYGPNCSSQPTFLRPRVIGTSKWLCYLCYLFLRNHNRFVPANTHGRLYDQWTVPDLAEYGDELCTHYRSILHAIDREIIKEAETIGLAETESPCLTRWRPEPMTSRQNLLNIDSPV